MTILDISSLFFYFITMNIKTAARFVNRLMSTIRCYKNWIFNRTQSASIATGVILFSFFSGLLIIGNAQINSPKIGGKELSGEDPIADMNVVLSGVGATIFPVLQVVVYLVAAFMIIVGIVEGWKKGEWGKFIVGIILVIVMFVFSTYFLSQGTAALDGLAS